MIDELREMTHFACDLNADLRRTQRDLATCHAALRYIYREAPCGRGLIRPDFATVPWDEWTDDEWAMATLRATGGEA